MITCKCIQKFRDRNNVIYGYRLIDINGKTQDVTPADLKNAIRNKQVNVVNLSLTSDSRLIDKKEETILENKKIMPNEVKKPREINEEINEVLHRMAEKVVKSLGYSEVEYVEHEDSTPGYVHMIVSLPNLIYRGTRRDLDMLVDLDSQHKKFHLGLIDEEAFYTEADTNIDLVKPFKNNIRSIEEFVDKYIAFLHKAPKIPYYTIVTTMEIDEDLPIHQKYSPYQLIYKVENPNQLEDITESYFNNMYGLYEIDSNEVKVLRDNIPLVAVKFSKHEKEIETLIYGIKKTPDVPLLAQKLGIEKQRADKEKMEFCEKYMGMHHFKYLGKVKDFESKIENTNRVVTLDVFVR